MENGVTSELMLNAALLIEALETVTLPVVTFFIASVCVTLFPTDTVPNDTDDGVEVREDACAAHVTRATAQRASKKVTAYRRVGHPG
jgi:hypothetical protein